MDSSNILSMKLEKGKNESKIVVSYFVPEINRNRTEEINEPPHGDFLKALAALSPFLSRVFYATEDKANLYCATGFKYSSTEKVIITGKVATESGSIVGIATPAINVENETYGFEEEFEDAIGVMVGETHLLLTGKKVGVKQLTIDDSIKQNESDGENTEPVVEEEVPDYVEPPYAKSKK